MANPRFWLSEAVKFTISGVILALAMAVAIAMVVFRAKPADRAGADLTPLVTTQAAEEYRGTLDLLVSGTVVPHREIKVSAEVSGRIKARHEECRAGVYVSQQTPLITIDPADYELDLRRLQSEVRQAETMLEETIEELRGAQETLGVTREEFRVQQEEYERRKRAAALISRSELNQAEQAYLAGQSALQTRENQIAVLERRKTRMESAIELTQLQVERAELDLRRTIVAAPSDGVVVATNVEEGDFIQRGQPLFSFEETGQVEVRCNLTAAELKWILENSPGLAARRSTSTLTDVFQLPPTDVKIFHPDEPELVWVGRLERFDGIGLDPQTKTIPCRILVEEPVLATEGGPRALLRGAFVKCRIEILADQMVGEGKRFVQFPERAVQPGGYVWLNESGKLARREVAVVDRIDVAGDADPRRVVLHWTVDSVQPGALTSSSRL